MPENRGDCENNNGRKKRLVQLLSGSSSNCNNDNENVEVDGGDNKGPSKRGRSRSRGRNLMRRAKSMAKQQLQPQQSHVVVDPTTNCQNVQPRYSASPEKLHLRPTQSSNLDNAINSRNNNRRRAKSEIRNCNNVWFYAAPQQPLIPVDFNTEAVIRLQQAYEAYAEPKGPDERHRRGRQRRRASKSRSRVAAYTNNGLLTIWPGKAGIWLPMSEIL